MSAFVELVKFFDGFIRHVPPPHDLRTGESVVMVVPQVHVEKVAIFYVRVSGSVGICFLIGINVVWRSNVLLLISPGLSFYHESFEDNEHGGGAVGIFAGFDYFGCGFGRSG